MTRTSHTPQVGDSLPGMESIQIHHPKLKLSTVVPRTTADVLASNGWKRGNLPQPRGKGKTSSKGAK